MNTRTSGILSKEDVESMERKQSYSGEGGDELNHKPMISLDGFSFSDDDDMIHSSSRDREGDQHKSAQGTACSC